MQRKATFTHLAIFILPALLLICVFVFYPCLRTISLSFFSEGKFSLHNYYEVLKSRDTINLEGFSKGFPLGTLFHNLLWIIIHLPLTTFLGLTLAVYLKNVKGGSIIKSIIFLGMVMPMITGGVMIRFIFDKNIGIVNEFLKLFGFLPKAWTAYPETALFALIFGSVWLWAGFSMILYSAGLETIPKDLYEAAQIDGASSMKMFFKITIPLLKPITIVIVTMTMLWELKIFDIIYVATMGGPGSASNVLALQMYTYAFKALNFGKSSVVAVFLTIITLAVSIPMARSAGEER